MNKFQIVLILTIAINTMACGPSKTIIADNQNKETTAWQSLSDEKFEIKYPSDWTVDKSGIMGSNFILFSPLSNKSDNFIENVNLLIQDLTGSNLTLDQYAEISENQIKTMITDSKIFLNERIKDGKSEYQKLIYSGKQGIYDLKFEQYYWVIEDEVYVLTLTCKVDEFDNYKATGEKILNSFEIK